MPETTIGIVIDPSGAEAGSSKVQVAAEKASRSIVAMHEQVQRSMQGVGGVSSTVAAQLSAAGARYDETLRRFVSAAPQVSTSMNGIAASAGNIAAATAKASSGLTAMAQAVKVPGVGIPALGVSGVGIGIPALAAAPAPARQAPTVPSPQLQQAQYAAAASSVASLQRAVVGLDTSYGGLSDTLSRNAGALGSFLRAIGPIGGEATMLASRLERAGLVLDYISQRSSKAATTQEVLTNAYKQGAIALPTMEAAQNRLSLARNVAEQAEQRYLAVLKVAPSVTSNTGAAAELLTKRRAEMAAANREVAESEKIVNSATQAGSSSMLAVAGVVAGVVAVLATLAVGIYAVHKAWELLTSALREGAAQERVRVQFELLIRNTKAASDAFDELEKVATRSGGAFKTEQLTRVAGALYALGEGFHTAIDLAKAFAQAASATGQPIEGIQSAYIRMSEMLQSRTAVDNRVLQSFRQQFIDLPRLLADSMGKNVEVVRALLKTGQVSVDDLNKAFLDAAKTGGIFSQAMERNANTALGLVGQLRQRWRETLAAFGEPVVVAIEPVLRRLLPLGEGVEEIARRMGEQVAEFVRIIDHMSERDPWGSLVTGGKLAFQLLANEAAKALVEGFRIAGEYIGEHFKDWVRGGLTDALGTGLKAAGLATGNLALTAVGGQVQAFGRPPARPQDLALPYPQAQQQYEQLKENWTKAMAAAAGDNLVQQRTEEMVKQAWEKALKLPPGTIAPRQQFVTPPRPGEESTLDWLRGLEAAVGPPGPLGEPVREKAERFTPPTPGTDLAALDQQLTELNRLLNAVDASPIEKLRGAFGEALKAVGSLRDPLAALPRLLETIGRAPGITELDKQLVTLKAHLADLEQAAQRPQSALELSRVAMEGLTSAIDKSRDPISFLQNNVERLQAILALLPPEYRKNAEGVIQWAAAYRELQLRAAETEARMKAGQASFGESIGFGLEKLKEQFGTFQEGIGRATVAIGQALSSDITAGLADIATGTKTVAQGFRDMTVAILRDISQIIIKLLIEYYLQLAITALRGGGAVGGGGNYLGVAGLSQAGGAHSGRIIGSAEPPSFIRTLHNGAANIRHDEELAVLQHGEGVFTKRQMRNMYVPPTETHQFSSDQLGAIGGLRHPRQPMIHPTPTQTTETDVSPYATGERSRFGPYVRQPLIGRDRPPPPEVSMHTGGPFLAPTERQMEPFAETGGAPRPQRHFWRGFFSSRRDDESRSPRDMPPRQPLVRPRIDLDLIEQPPGMERRTIPRQPLIGRHDYGQPASQPASSLQPTAMSTTHLPPGGALPFHPVPMVPKMHDGGIARGGWGRGGGGRRGGFRVTGYGPHTVPVPGSVEGPVSTSSGWPMQTLEAYRAGQVPYVTVATDPKVIPTGTYFTSPQYPGVIFRASDTGPAVTGKHFDIATAINASQEQMTAVNAKNVHIRTLSSSEFEAGTSVEPDVLPGNVGWSGGPVGAAPAGYTYVPTYGFVPNEDVPFYTGVSGAPTGGAFGGAVPGGEVFGGRTPFLPYTPFTDFPSMFGPTPWSGVAGPLTDTTTSYTPPTGPGPLMDVVAGDYYAPPTKPGGTSISVGGTNIRDFGGPFDLTEGEPLPNYTDYYGTGLYGTTPGAEPTQPHVPPMEIRKALPAYPIGSVFYGTTAGPLGDTLAFPTTSTYRYTPAGIQWVPKAIAAAPPNLGAAITTGPAGPKYGWGPEQPSGPPTGYQLPAISNIHDPSFDWGAFEEGRGKRFAPGMLMQNLSFVGSGTRAPWTFEGGKGEAFKFLGSLRERMPAGGLGGHLLPLAGKGQREVLGGVRERHEGGVAGIGGELRLVDLSSIPFFQRGGTMQDDGLAFLHRGENVTPAGGGAAHVENHTNISITIHEGGGSSTRVSGMDDAAARDMAESVSALVDRKIAEHRRFGKLLYSPTGE